MAGSRLIDLTNKKIGKWLVLKRILTKKRKYTVWLCRCECGHEKEVIASHLCAGKTKGCCKCSAKKGGRHKQWRGYGEISGNFWNSLKRGAAGDKGRRNPIVVQIDIKYAWKLFLKQDRKCALTGLLLKFVTGADVQCTTASLDRIDSSKGYIKGNVQWVHKHVNMMKRTYEQEYFIEMCNKIAKLHPRD